MPQQSTRDFLVCSVLKGEHETLELEINKMKEQLTLKEGGKSSWGDIQFYKDDIRDLQKVKSWIHKRIKEITE